MPRERGAERGTGLKEGPLLPHLDEWCRRVADSRPRVAVDDVQADDDVGAGIDATPSVHDDQLAFLRSAAPDGGCNG